MLKRIGGVVGAGLKAFAKALPTMMRDGAGLIGVGLIAYGAWLVHPPAGFITGGVLLLVGAVLVSLNANRGTGG